MLKRLKLQNHDFYLPLKQAAKMTASCGPTPVSTLKQEWQVAWPEKNIFICFTNDHDILRQKVLCAWQKVAVAEIDYSVEKNIQFSLNSVKT
jgi:hypothetical protein